jgi:NitT/TauT family transport system permease protein
MNWSRLGGRTIEAVLSFAALMVLLEFIVRYFDVEEYILPAPSAVAVALWYGLVGGSYWHGLAVTLEEILAGFFIGSACGIVLGMIMVNVKIVERIVYPYVVAVQTVPKVAIAPLMIVWFGFGIESKIIVVALTCLFPSLINTIVGLRATDSDRVALVRSMCGTRLQLLRYVQFPSALPFVMAGLSTGMVLAVIGAIVGEFVGAKAGIGVLILQANSSLDLPSVFALLVLLAAAGVLLNFILSRIEARLCFWSGKSSK